MTTEVPAAATVEPHRRGVTSGGLRDRLGRGFALTFALGLGWSLYRALTDQGWIIDDELSHYLFSRAVWDEPKELLQIWTRPGRNLIQFVPSYSQVSCGVPLRLKPLKSTVRRRAES